jgi:Sec-independent protein secretion pathway component TatC
MLLLAIPMIFLYELGIILIGRNQRKETYAGWSS